MKVILNVGRPKTGKTVRSKKILMSMVREGRKDDMIIYDCNNEYSEFYPYPFIQYEQFMKPLKGCKNKILLFEEATIFFSNRSEEIILKEIMVRKRHDNNIIILNFHSIRSIPRYVFDLTDYVILFKTNDTIDIVKSKCDKPSFLESFTEVNNNSNPHYSKIIDIYNS